MTDTSSPNLELIATRRHFRGEGFLPKDAFLERIAATLERIDEKLGESINEYGQFSVIADTTTKLAFLSEVGVWLNKNTALAIKDAASSISAAIEEQRAQRAEWEP